MKIQPMGDYILVEPIGAPSTLGGIIIPDSAKKGTQQSKVLRLGTGGIDREGNPVEFLIKEGDTVIITKYAGSDIRVSGGQVFKLIRNIDVLAIVEEVQETTEDA